MPLSRPVFSVLVLACAAAGDLGCAAPRLAAVEIGPPGTDATPVDQSARLDRPAVEGPGCAWTGSLLTPRGEKLPLCFAVDGACFAQVSSPFVGRATVTFPEGKTAEKGAKVELVDDGVRLGAWTAGDGVLLFGQHPLLFGAATVVIGSPAVFVERVHDGTVDLSFRGDASVKLRTGDLKVRAPCPSVGLGPDQWSPAEVLSVAGVWRPNATDWLLPVDQPIAISALPGGAPVLDIVVPSEEEARVEVVERRGSWSRVLSWQADGGVVFGWVDTAVLGVAPPRPESLGSSANGPPIGSLSLPVLGTACPVDLPLYAAVAGMTAEVGTIVARTRFDLSRITWKEYTQIKIRSHHLESMPDSVWLARTADLQACAIQ